MLAAIPLRALPVVVLAAQFFGRPAFARQLDPVDNFCYRLQHQSVIKNSTLYIDGGIESYVDLVNGSQLGPVVVGYNNRIITTDLARSWDWKTNISQNSLEKGPSPATGTSAPVLVEGALYQGRSEDRRIYLWGGTVSYLNTSFPNWTIPSPSTYSLWSLDLETNEWSQADVVASNLTNRPSAGAATEATDLGLAFYYNGRVDGGSSSSTTYLQGSGASANLAGLVVINTTAMTATNYSTHRASGNWPVSLGAAEYIPAVGTHGAIVALGGMAKRAGDALGTDDGNYTTFAVVDVFDVGSIFGGAGDTWYKQNTTGQIPEGRGEFCTALISDSDNSTHNIYLYGGRRVVNNKETTFDDVYVLSIPSFIWSQVYQDGSSPRYGHTCHVVGETREMITVGGAAKYDFVTGSYSQVSAPLGCDWETRSVAILDMSTVTWGSVYNASAIGYTLPGAVKKNIVGDNGQMSRKPFAGFDSVAMAALFGQNSSAVAPWGLPSPSARPTATSDPPSSSSSRGAVIGGSIGGATGFVAILYLLALLRTTRRLRRSSQPPVEEAYQRRSTAWQVDLNGQHELRGCRPHELPEQIRPEMAARQQDLYELPARPAELPTALYDKSPGRH